MFLNFIIDYVLLFKKKKTTKGKREPMWLYTGICLFTHLARSPPHPARLIDFVVLKIDVLYWVILVGGELRL